MRFRTRDAKPAWLGYCANVHPGESLDSVLHAVRHYAQSVRRELDVPELALGLWLSRAALSELEQTGLEPLTAALAEAGIWVGTLNGFPYGDFHAPVVKRRVYHPDLGTSERRAYLAGLAKILAGLMPGDLSEGTISTLPLGHRDEALDGTRPAARSGRPPRASAELRRTAAERAAQQLCLLSDELVRLRDQTGKSIRICLEPEPGCWLETIADALEFFGDHLPRVARASGTSQAALDQHLGLCYDTCHQAICFEDAVDSIRALQQARVRIGKVQLSSALEIAEPADPALRAELLRFDEPRFLHQVRARRADGSLASADDLSEIEQLPQDRPWRVHFHVPIHRPLLGRISTTRRFLEEALPALCALPELPHLEVETYTWAVLPEGERPRDDADLVRGLAEELRWARGVLT